MTAALLHDIGLVKGDKVEHALESAKIFMNYIIMKIIQLMKLQKFIMSVKMQFLII